MPFFHPKKNRYMKLPDLQIDDSMCCEVPEGVGTAELLAVLAAYLAYLASWLTLQVPLLLHSCETCHLIGEDDSMFLFFFSWNGNQCFLFMKWKPETHVWANPVYIFAWEQKIPSNVCLEKTWDVAITSTPFPLANYGDHTWAARVEFRQLTFFRM